MCLAGESPPSIEPATQCLLGTRSLHVILGGECEVENSSAVTSRLGSPGPSLITRQCCISAEVLAAALLWLLLPTYIVLSAPTDIQSTYVNGLVVVVHESNSLIDVLFLYLLLSKVSQWSNQESDSRWLAWSDQAGESYYVRINPSHKGGGWGMDLNPRFPDILVHAGPTTP